LEQNDKQPYKIQISETLSDKKSSKQLSQWTLSLSPLGLNQLLLVKNPPVFTRQLHDTHLDTYHRIRQQDKAHCNVKIELCYWLLLCMCLHDNNQLVVLDRVTELVLNFPAPFWSPQPKRDLGLTSLFTT
jgi:hypothetical protein